MVPYHIATLTKPQITYDIKPDNTNTPFNATLPDELCVFDAQDFVESIDNLQTLVPVAPLSLESTPFSLVDTLDGLKALASKLMDVHEFAVDLEANMYRSFQGLTCLMQISTRDEDFVVDTLKLHDSIGPCLGSLFLDPCKKKVMHGAVNDILWLQRDFGMYVCNLFDTQQASRILKLDRNSLEHLLKYFCGVQADKQYQTSDWRIRPLPKDMLHYAREDTHYLLYIYDLMRKRLVSPISEFDLPLLEVYRNSHNLCTALYEKELYDENSYKSLFGLEEAALNSIQLYVASRLHQWRDALARDDDESTGYVMPNKLLLEISQKMPNSRSQLMSIVRDHNYPNHPYALKNADEILKIIQESTVQIQPNSGVFPRHRYHVIKPYPPMFHVVVPRRPRFYVAPFFPVMAKPVCIPRYCNPFMLC